MLTKMVNKILERETPMRDYLANDCEAREICVISEMKAQRGYAEHLRRTGQLISDSVISNYRDARDAAIVLGVDVTNFPKSLRRLAV